MQGIIILTITGFVMGVILVSLNDLFKKNKSDDFLKLLPGYNCNSCGFGSCKGMSEAMLKDIENYKKCRPLRGEALKKMEEFICEVK